MESPHFKNKKTVSLPIPIKYEKDNSLNNNSKNTSHTFYKTFNEVFDF